MNHSPKCEAKSLVHTLFKPSGSGGVYARTGIFEQVTEGLQTFISRHREPETEILRFPPVMNRIQLERSGYLQSFPHLLGCVSGLQGDEAQVRSQVEKSDWPEHLSATDLVLSPAACYPVYPLAASRGPVPASGLLFDVASYCFRREATHEPGRFQSFQMREYVCIGTPARVLDFRQRWIARGKEMADQLGLEYEVAGASDPFFGRAGRLAAMSQLEQALKFELLIPVRSAEEPTACMSFNYHLDHFTAVWQLASDAGETVHTVCVAFGIDRLALALFAAHGLDLKAWPSTIRERLSI